MESQKGRHQFSWGDIRWLSEIQTMGRNLCVGIVTILSGEKQNLHKHAVDEQVIYVISGTGEHILNESRSNLKCGDVVHITAGSEHMSINLSQEPLVLMLVSAPHIPQDKLSLFKHIDKKNTTPLRDPLKNMRLDEIIMLQESLGKAINMGVGFFDHRGVLLCTPYKWAEFCSMENMEICKKAMYKHARQLEHQGGSIIKQCCRDLYCVFMPFFDDDKLLWFIKGGPVHICEPQDYEFNDLTNEQLVAYKGIVVEPKNRIFATENILKEFVRSLLTEGQILSMQCELDIRDNQLSENIKKNLELKSHLNEIQMKAFLYQMNPHFLFNTLNAISGLALMEGALKTNKSILLLSSLMRQILDADEKLVSIRIELDNISSYLYLQKIRFGEKLQFAINIDKAVEQLMIPYMTLQPLVENAIIHGISNLTGQGLIEINAYKTRNKYVLSVLDNGTGMNSNLIAELNAAQFDVLHEKSLIGLGLHNVYQRLKNYYSDNVDFKFNSREGKGLYVVIEISE